MRKIILCSREGCNRVFAHLLNGRSIDIMRQDRHTIITGKDYTINNTCNNCNRTSTFFVEDGKFNEDGVIFREDPHPEPPIEPAPVVPEPVV